jgi:archaellum component FlaC
MMHDKESRAKKIEQLEARMNALMAKYKEVKNRLGELGDEESEEAYNLGLVEFNLFNSIDMLDEKIQELKSIDADL